MWLQHFAVWPLWISVMHPALVMLLLCWCRFKHCSQTRCPRPTPHLPQTTNTHSHQCQGCDYWSHTSARRCMTCIGSCWWPEPGWAYAAHRIDPCPPLPECGVESRCMLPLFQLFCNPPQGNHNWICHQFPCFCPLEDWFLQLLTWEVGIDGSSCLKSH